MLVISGVVNHNRTLIFHLTHAIFTKAIKSNRRWVLSCAALVALQSGVIHSTQAATSKAQMEMTLPQRYSVTAQSICTETSTGKYQSHMRARGAVNTGT